MMDEKMDVIVVGAGIVGTSVAYHLSLEGLKVCLMDREAVGSGASAHGHGLLSVVGRDFKPGPYFLLGLESARMFPDFVDRVMDEVKVAPLFQECLGVNLALTEEEEEIFRHSMSWQQDYLDMRWASTEEIRSIEPRITPDARGGVLNRYGQVDAYKLCLALTQAVEQRGGQVLLREATGIEKEGTRATGVTYPGGRVMGDVVVVAMGAWSGIARQWLNFPVPVRPLHGEVLHVVMDGDPLRLFVLTARHGPIIQRLDGTILVGSLGGVSMSGMDVDALHVFDPEDEAPLEFDLSPSQKGRDSMLEKVVKVMPEIADARVIDHLAGVRPLCADRMPLIGPVPGWTGVYLATGHGTKGIHLSAVTGKIIADQIVRGESSIPADAFSPGRFLTS